MAAHPTSHRAKTLNEHQRDQFLWPRSQRRTRGVTRVGVVGVLVGAAGGLLFSAILLSAMGTPTKTGYTGLAALRPIIERAGRTLLLTVPTLAALGFTQARRVYALHEQMFRALLQTGARVPTHQPVLQTRAHWPAMAVGVTVAVLVGFVGYPWWAAGSGRL